ISRSGKMLWGHHLTFRLGSSQVCCLFLAFLSMLVMDAVQQALNNVPQLQALRRYGLMMLRTSLFLVEMVSTFFRLLSVLFSRRLRILCLILFTFLLAQRCSLMKILRLFAAQHSSIDCIFMLPVVSASSRFRKHVRMERLFLHSTMDSLKTFAATCSVSAQQDWVRASV